VVNFLAAFWINNQEIATYSPVLEMTLDETIITYEKSIWTETLILVVVVASLLGLFFLVLFVYKIIQAICVAVSKYKSNKKLTKEVHVEPDEDD
jgi:hypothetical protein